MCLVCKYCFTTNKQKPIHPMNCLHLVCLPLALPSPSPFLARTISAGDSSRKRNDVGQLSSVDAEQFAGAAARHRVWSQTGGGEEECRRRFPKSHPRVREVFAPSHVQSGAFMPPPPITSTALSRQMKSTISKGRYRERQRRRGSRGVRERNIALLDYEGFEILLETRNRCCTFTALYDG